MSSSAFTASIAALGFGSYLLYTRHSPNTLRSSDFFQPRAVADIADDFPVNEDQFIRAAWRYAADLTYEDIGSNVNFTDGAIECEDCYLPDQSLRRGEGNCLAKAALLASLLVNRIAPERVQILVGDYVEQGRPRQGHAWTEVWRATNSHGDWYLLEATHPPRGWVIADHVYDQYNPAVVIEQGGVKCADERYCSRFRFHYVRFM